MELLAGLLLIAVIILALWVASLRRQLQPYERCGVAGLQFGREKVVKAAQERWGEQAVDMLALLLAAQKDLDLAKRILTPESFKRVKPWLEQNLHST